VDVKQRVFLGVCLVVSASIAVGAPSGAAKTFPLKAKAPARGTAKGLMSRKFKETVTCAQACKVKTTVVIKAKAARQLGFSHVTGKYVTIARNKGTLKARIPTKMPFVITQEAKRRLTRAKTIAIFGGVQSFPTGRPGVNYSIAWSSKLT
jgi:hypothetical protein